MHSNRRCLANEPDHDARKCTAAAIVLWQATQSADGTPVEIYLRARGLAVSPPPTIRFHARLNHPSGDTWPAMVALVTHGADNTPLAIHRTFLARNGASKAPVEPQKMMLGLCRGGAVRLGIPRAGRWLAVTEGIETALAVATACTMPAWAALSAGGIRALGYWDGSIRRKNRRETEKSGLREMIDRCVRPCADAKA